ncbi:MAG: response regulator transcription factor [Armatimonadota bacterium]|nr:response regulator transcription factor [Armatimonadota bacterium]
MPKHPQPIRILLIEDHAMVRAGLRLLLSRQSNLTVVGEASNRAEALAQVRRQQPDIILLDLMLGAESGLDLLPELIAGSRARVIALTGVTEEEMHRRARALGARGLVLKGQAPEVLLQAIAKVRAGELCFDPAVLAIEPVEQPPQGEVKSDPEAAKIALLSDREREVLALVCQGLKNHQIGARLYITETTVRHHMNAIYAKLKVSDRLELLIYALRNGICQPPTR